MNTTLRANYDTADGQPSRSKSQSVSSFHSHRIDYAGPMHLLHRVARGARTTKHYVAVFVCFTTKAIHLECADDYSTFGFLAVFSRFASRCSLPSHVYSDNGTNFQEEDRELRLMTRDPNIGQALARDGVSWHFIPAAAPHFGGLWKAGDKSVKHHLQHVSNSHTLSRAEFTTLLCKIETYLNSRPLAPLTDDPTDLSALMPGHFLIGRPLVCAPEESSLDLKVNSLSRWQLVRKLQEQFWHAWSNDYLNAETQMGGTPIKCANR